MPDNDKITESVIIHLIETYGNLANQQRFNLAKHCVRTGQINRGHSQLMKVLENNSNHVEARRLMELMLFGPVWPVQLCIEPTNECHVGCPGCGGRDGEIGYMDLDLFRTLMLEVAPHLRILALHNRGESFHHPKIYDFLDVVGQFKHISTYIHTAGHLPLDAERIVRAQVPTELVFSLDGFTEKTHRKYRIGADFQIAIDNIKRLKKEKRKLNVDKPKIVWKYIMMGTNEREVRQAMGLAAELGCDEFRMAPFAVGWKTIEGKVDAYLKKFLPSDDRNLRNDREALMQGKIVKAGRKPGEPFNCMVVHNSTAIRWDGKVLPCCNCLEPYQQVMGVYGPGMKFKDIWDSTGFRSFRKAAVLDARRLKPCSMCHMI